MQKKFSPYFGSIVLLRTSVFNLQHLVSSVVIAEHTQPCVSVAEFLQQLAYTEDFTTKRMCVLFATPCEIVQLECSLHSNR